MIGIQGQYKVQFSIGSLTDFITENNLEQFMMIEEVGNILPTFQLQFLIADDKLALKEFTEGNDLNVSFGNPDLTGGMVTTKFAISKVHSERTGDAYRRIIAIGLYSALNYIIKPVLDIWDGDKKSGIEVMKKIAGNHFQTDFNKETSDDSQYWLQPNISDKLMINQLHMHSYLAKSFIAIGITTAGKFKMRDIRKLAGEGPKWTFTYQPQGGKDILMDSGLSSTSNTGFLNYYFGYGRKKLINKLEPGTSEYFEVNPEAPMFADSPSLNRKASVPVRYDLNFPLSDDNVHKNYWKAKNQNLANLATFSSISCITSYENVHKPVEVLDHVLVKDDAQAVSKQEGSSEFVSGAHIVTKVTRKMTAKSFFTIVEFNRECFSSIKGSLR